MTTITTARHHGLVAAPAIPRLLPVILAAIFLSAFAVACDGNNDVPATPAPTPSPQPTPTPTPPEMHDIDIQLQTTRPAYAPGETVQFTIVATNTTGGEIELEFPTGQRFDIEVERDNVVVWAWSDGRVFTQAIEYIDLGPGESLEYDATWDQLDRDDEPVPAGVYTARAVITATSMDEEAVVEFTIED